MHVLLFRVCFRYMLLIVKKLPSCTLVCGIVWTFARNGKGYALIARYVGSRYVGYSGPLPEMVKGMCLEPAMLCRPPLTSPRRGWMELPDVGDFCQVVIQKWMNHILTEIPLHLLYV
ncbi:unnamed protein product [Musa textilis]